MLRALGWNAIAREDLAGAGEAVQRLLSEAPSFEGKQEHGDALHHGATIAGLVALSREDVPAAEAALLRSAETPGSALLSSAGPSFALAAALVRRGRTAAVTDFLRACRGFWEDGALDLDADIGRLERAELPSFAAP